jgi:hypothetical protein
VSDEEGARVLAALADDGYVEPFDDYWSDGVLAQTAYRVVYTAEQGLL